MFTDDVYDDADVYVFAAVLDDADVYDNDTYIYDDIDVYDDIYDNGAGV